MPHANDPSHPMPPVDSHSPRPDPSEPQLTASGSAAESPAATVPAEEAPADWKPNFTLVDFATSASPSSVPAESAPALWPHREGSAGDSPEPSPAAPPPEPTAPGAGFTAAPPLPPDPSTFPVEPRHRPRQRTRATLQKLGIVGGKGVGKSYLFQAMVYRTYSNTQAGALAYYLDRGGIRLHTALDRNEPESPESIERFIEKFSAWDRLPQTLADTQRWYRLRLPYRAGWLGRGRAVMDVEFLDGSGEGFFALEFLDEDYRNIWRDAYLDARVMVFCLPLWVAFPGEDLDPEDRRERNQVLRQFEQVIENYRQLREAHGADAPVRSILALTMADDRRSALTGLRDRWITPYMNAPQQYLSRLRRSAGVATYLANARRVSAALQAEFDHSHNPRVSGIPNRLDFGAGRPWLIPLSAIDGRKLEHIEAEYPDPDLRRELDLRPPVPVHVELPLLVALCERENALM